MILSYLSFTRTEGVLHLKIGRCVSRPSNWRYVFQFRPTYAWDLLTWGFLDGTTRAVGGGLLAGAEDLSRWLPRALSRHRDDWRPMHQLLGRSASSVSSTTIFFVPFCFLLERAYVLRLLNFVFPRGNGNAWRMIVTTEEMVLVWKSRLYQGPLSSATFGADVEMHSNANTHLGRNVFAENISRCIFSLYFI
jgi:hypothetical protein